MSQEGKIVNGNLWIPAPRRWFVFGEHPVTGMVDVSNGERDVYENVPRAFAKRVIELRDAFVDAWMAEPIE